MSGFVLVMGVFTHGQNAINSTENNSTIKSDEIAKDTALKNVSGKNYQITDTKKLFDYNSAKYHKIDFPQTNTMKIERIGSNPDIYLSNSYPGIMQFPVTGQDNSLIKFYISLDRYPNYYESSSLQDSSICWNDNMNSPVFDFVKISSLNQAYKNAFNHNTVPGTSGNFGKQIYNEFKSTDILGQVLYNIFLFAPKK
jgi:hypothetical protein